MIIIEKNKGGITVAFDEKLNGAAERSGLEKYEAISFNGLADRLLNEDPLFFHVTNEGTGSGRRGADLKSQGVKTGVADYLYLSPHGCYNFLAIELKRARKKDSSISKEQSDWIKSAEKSGGRAVVCYGYRAAIHVLELYITGKL